MFARLTKLIQTLRGQFLVPAPGEKVWVLDPDSGRYFVGHAEGTSWSHLTGPQVFVWDAYQPSAPVRLADVRWSARPMTTGEWLSYAPETDRDRGRRQARHGSPRPPKA